MQLAERANAPESRSALRELALRYTAVAAGLESFRQNVMHFRILKALRHTGLASIF